MDFRPRFRRSFALALLAIFLVSADSTPALAAGIGDYTSPFQSLVSVFENVFAEIIALVDPHQAVTVAITPAVSSTWHASGATASAAAFNSVAAFQPPDPVVPPTIVHVNTTSNASLSVKGAATSNAPSFTASALPPAPQAQLASYVTQTDLTTQLQQLTNKLTTLVYQNVSAPNSVIATGGVTNEIAGTNRINQLSGVAITGGSITNAIVNGVSGLTAADIPALAYLSTSGGSLSGALGIGTTSPSDLFALNCAAYLANIAVPPVTTNRLYSNSGNLYWAGNLLGGATTGNWSSDGTNVWRAGGNVGIGTTSPFSSLSVQGNGYFTGSLIGDVSGASIISSGSTISRTLAAIEGDTINILSRQAQVASNTDFTAAINAALAGTVPVFLPQTGTPYQINGTLTFGAGSTLICQPGVQIDSVGSNQIFTVANPNVTIRDCTFIKPTGSSGSLGVISSDHFTWNGGGSTRTGGLFLNTTAASYALIANTRQLNGTGTAISVQNGANHNTIRDNEFQNNAGFGVWVTLGANANLIDGNWTDSNGIELIGITYTGYDNTVTNNRAQGTGDNCFSISGYNNRVIGNTGYHCAFTGLYLYGNNNTATGNTLIGNGQVHNPSFTYYNSGNANLYGGITIGGAFGGAGQNNVVTGNFVDDDQASPTQAYGIKIIVGYSSWASGTAYTAGTQVYSSGNIYQATNAATSGSTAPTCSSGTCSDGNVTWSFIAATPLSTREPAGNAISGNRVWRYGSAAFSDSTINHNNVVMLENTISLSGSLPTGSGINTVAGGFQKKIGTNWAQGISVQYGELVYTNNGNNLYRIVNAGGTTGSVQPANTSGTQTTSDGISWLWLASGAFYPQLNISSSDITLGARLMLPVMESATATCPEYAGTGSPEAKVTAPVCAIYLRSDGSTSSTLYVKENGTGSTGWIASGTGNWALSGNNLFSNIATNVGIGTTTPYSRLTVWGRDTASSTLAFNVVNNASTTVFAVFDGGNAQLSGTLTQSSDARLKTNIQSLDASTSLAAINSLIPVAYDWLDPDKGGVRQYGFIAQQVEPLFPNLVSTTSATALTPDGTLGLNYIGLIAPVIRAIQALSTEIASLENSIAGFSESFTTRELTFTRATGDEIDAKKLCLQKSDGSNVCVTGDQLATAISGASSSAPANGASAPSSDTTPPIIAINGNNTAHVNVGDTYVDLGAIITGPQADLNLGIKTFLNGMLTSNIVVDTSQAATDTIDYVVSDSSGLAATSTRTVIVQAPSASNAASAIASSTVATSTRTIIVEAATSSVQ
jgi:hypothetical protein